MTEIDWNKANTLATAAAAIAAVTVPFLLNYLQIRTARKATTEARRNAYYEVLHAIMTVLRVYDEAFKKVSAGKSFQGPDRERQIRDLEERAWRSRHVIHHLLQQRELTDGLIRCGLDAAALGEETAKAIHHLYAQNAVEANRALLFNEIRRKRTSDGLDTLRKHHKINTGEEGQN